jgi:hypothetical protein
MTPNPPAPANPAAAVSYKVNASAAWSLVLIVRPKYDRPSKARSVG